MELKLNEKKAAQTLNSYRIEYNAKPNLMAATINNDNTLVIVIDMIVGFCVEGALSSSRAANVIAPIRDLLLKLPKARKAFVRDCHEENAIEFKSFPPHCHNKLESALVKDLAEFLDIDVPKNSTNGFFALRNIVNDLASYKNVVLVGVCTDICVLQLGLTLKAYFNEMNRDNNVIVFSSCVETYDSPLHDAELSNVMALKLLEQAGVIVYKGII